ncbi:dynein heavy chain 6, axonemal-like [Acyrthosiphon pisum]|uniref:Uncharacterized protein n=1 Tax=Acyrthosiphon pisum TaxID=7029 RepID=A0A8R2JKU9_ACYPI|nr:dynein heavy chain 6, axonemal-like [Acyrthosiphon pisum]
MLSHIQNEVTFTTFAQFEEEYRSYKKVVKIPLFKNYLQWKCLHFWYKYISQNKYSWAREELQAPLSLFMLSAPLRDASLKVSALIYQTATISLYNGSVTEENTLQGFKEQQESSTEAAVGQLQNLRLTVKDLVLGACSSALAECGFTTDDSEFRVTKVSRIAKSHGADGDSRGTTGYTMPFVKQRSKLKCCQRICRFIAFVDFQLQSHLHKIARNQIVRFEADVRRHYKYVPVELRQMNGHADDVDTMLESDKSSDEPKSPLFVLEAFLTKNGIEFDNAQSDFINYVSLLIENWKWIIITHFPPLLDDIEFNDFVIPSICGNQNDRVCGNGPSLQFVFEIDGAYQNTTEKIFNYFTTNFKAVHKYLKRLEYVHIIYRDNEDIDRGSIENETSKYLVTY